METPRSRAAVPDPGDDSVCAASQDHALRPGDVVDRAIRGAVSLGGGQAAAQVLNIAGAIVLARVLTPAEFGLVAIFTFFLGFLTALGDLGLAMSLVRQPAEPSDHDFRVVCTFQNVVATIVVLAACAATPWVLGAYGLPIGTWWWLPAMALAILADSVRFRPLVRLERQLRFERIGAIEVAQAVAFNAVLLPLAVSGYGAGAFPVAVFVRSAFGAVVARLLGPSVRGWSWHWAIARRYLAFGLPYQGVHLVTVIRTSVVPVFVGLLLGGAAVGRLEWAAMVAGFPLTGLILLQRLYVGTFSRLRAHPDKLSEFVTSIVSMAHAIVAPAAVLTLVLIDPIVRLVFGPAWLPAVPLFRWLWLACLVIPTTAPLTGLLHAFGHSRVVLAVSLAASIATWLVAVPLLFAMGEPGIAIATLTLHAGGLAIWIAARRLVAFALLKPVAVVWACAAPAGVLAWWWHARSPLATLPDLLLCGAVAAALYAVLVLAAGAVLSKPAREVMMLVGRRVPMAAALRSPGGDL